MTYEQQKELIDSGSHVWIHTTDRGNKYKLNQGDVDLLRRWGKQDKYSALDIVRYTCILMADEMRQQ